MVSKQLKVQNERRSQKRTIKRDLFFMEHENKGGKK